MAGTRDNLVERLMEIEKGKLMEQVDHIENTSVHREVTSTYHQGYGASPQMNNSHKTPSADEYCADDEETMESRPAKGNLRLKKGLKEPEEGSVSDITVVGLSGKGKIADKWMSQIQARECREKEKFQQMQEEKMKDVRSPGGRPISADHSQNEIKGELEDKFDFKRQGFFREVESPSKERSTSWIQSDTPKQEITNKNMKEERNVEGKLKIEGGRTAYVTTRIVQETSKDDSTKLTSPFKSPAKPDSFVINQDNFLDSTTSTDITTSEDELDKVKAEYFATLEVKRQQYEAQKTFPQPKPHPLASPYWTNPLVGAKSKTFYLRTEGDAEVADNWRMRLAEMRNEADQKREIGTRPMSWTESGEDVNAQHQTQVFRSSSYRLKSEKDIERRKHEYRNEIEQWKKKRDKENEHDLSQRSLNSMEVSQTVTEKEGGRVLRSWSRNSDAASAGSLNGSLDDDKPIVSTRKVIYDRNEDYETSSTHSSDHNNPYLLRHQERPPPPPLVGKKPVKKPPTPVVMPERDRPLYPSLKMPREKSLYERREAPKLNAQISLTDELREQLKYREAVQKTERAIDGTMSVVYVPQNPYDSPEYYGEVPANEDEDTIRAKLQDMWSGKKPREFKGPEPPQTEHSNRDGRLNAYKEQIMDKWQNIDTERSFIWSELNKQQAPEKKVKRRVTIHSTDPEARELWRKPATEKVDFIPLYSHSTVEFKDIKPEPPTYGSVIYKRYSDPKPAPPKVYKEIERPSVPPQVQYVQREYKPIRVQTYEEPRVASPEAHIEYRTVSVSPPIKTLNTSFGHSPDYHRESSVYSDTTSGTIDLRPYMPRKGDSVSTYSVSSPLPSHDTMSVSSRVSSAAPEWGTLPRMHYSTPIKTAEKRRSLILPDTGSLSGTLRRTQTLDRPGKKSGRIKSEITLHMKRVVPPTSSQGSSNTLTNVGIQGSVAKPAGTHQPGKHHFFLGGGKDGQLSKDPFFQKGGLVGKSTLTTTTNTMAASKPEDATSDLETLFENDSEQNFSTDSEELERKLTESVEGLVDDDFEEDSFSDASILGPKEDSEDTTDDVQLPEGHDVQLPEGLIEDKEKHPQEVLKDKVKEGIGDNPDGVPAEETAGQDDDEKEGRESTTVKYLQIENDNEETAEKMQENSEMEAIVHEEVLEMKSEIHETSLESKGIHICNVSGEHLSQDVGVQDSVVDHGTVIQIDNGAALETLIEKKQSALELSYIDENQKDLAECDQFGVARDELKEEEHFEENGEVEEGVQFAEEYDMEREPHAEFDEIELDEIGLDEDTQEEEDTEYTDEMIEAELEEDMFMNVSSLDENEEEVEEENGQNEGHDGMDWEEEDEMDEEYIMKIYKEHVQNIREQAGIEEDAMSEDDDESILVVAGHDKEGRPSHCENINAFIFSVQGKT